MAISPWRSIGVLVVAIALIPCAAAGCRDEPAARSGATTRPLFSKGVLGVWVVRLDPTLQAITKVPHEMSHQFPNLPDYKAWLRKEVEGLQFEFYPENKVFLRYAGGGRPRGFSWERRDDGSYWLSEAGFLSPLSAGIGHRFDMSSDRAAVCRYQVQWNENSAPRSPLVLEKTWE